MGKQNNTIKFGVLGCSGVPVMTTSCRFKCVPAFPGSLSIHIFILLFRFIADSSVFMSDVTQECKTATEIGRPFEGMCDNFLLFIIREQTKALIWKAY